MEAHVVLVNPNMIDLYRKYPIRTMAKIVPQVPLGLCSLAAVLEKNGIPVSIIDNHVHEYTSQALADEILKKQPHLVGFSTMTQNVYQAFETAELLKKRNRDIKVVMGGIHASVLPAKVMENPNVDYVIVSEGEYTLLELSKAILEGKESHADIRGLFFRKANESIVYSGHRAPIEDLDALPWPARHLVHLEKYDRHAFIFGVKKMMALNTSRGCPFHCTFCSSSSYWNRKFRARTPSNVVDEIDYVKKKYGADGIRFREDNFTTSRKRIVALCDEMNRRGIGLPWECESRADTVDQDVLQIMKEAGCKAIWFGVESGNQKILDFLNKGTTLERIRKVFQWCHDCGIDTGATFMIGIPTETRQDVLQTFQFAKEIRPHWASFQAYLGLPTSSLYHYVLSHRMCFDQIDDICIVQTDQLSFEEIVRLEKFLNEEYYRFSVIEKSKNRLFRWIMRRIPFHWLNRMVSFYKSFSFSIRDKIKNRI